MNFVQYVPKVVSMKKTKEVSAFEKLKTSFSRYISNDQKAEILKKNLNDKMIKVLEDKDLIFSVDAFLENHLNVSETSRNAFMHRNTLLYRLDKIKRVTGLNIRHFEDAVVFKVLAIMYKEVYKEND